MNISIQTFMTGRCQARCSFRASYKGKNGPQPVVGILGSGNTHVFGRLARGNVPTRVEAFPALLFNVPHFLNPWSGSPWLRSTKS
jgi:hypothetical protein